MIFRSLKITGFKSFAEKAEVDIEPGLTGIVGPNGCGKSNVVEALRWVMGESSARQMRGSELDDLIFAGTESRPARNLAEIVLELDNSDHRAPAEFNKEEMLEITRKADRGKGSSYLVNGRPARARDVQLLFADTATGSRSAGIVSQGRIGAIVGAKPEDRRALLEEAANIRGLHQRRHEAELRLRAAETNLERLDDLIGQLEEQKSQLQKQARQAARYRSVADRIRKAEARLLLARWQDSTAELAAAEEALASCKNKTEQATRTAASATTQRLERAEALPPLRQAEAEQAAETQRLQLAIGESDREAARIIAELDRLASQLAQIENDRIRETALAEDAEKALAALADEEASLNAWRKAEGPRLDLADSELEKARQQADSADRAAADARAAFQAMQNERARLEARKTQLEARIAQSADGLAAVQLDQLHAAAETAAEAARRAEDELAKANSQTEKTSSELDAARSAREAAWQTKQEAESQLARLTAEMDALAYLLAGDADEAQIPVADSLTVKGGMEAALAACLADDLGLPLDAGERGYWPAGFTPAQPPQPPQTGTPLTQFVSGPKVIEQALAGVAVTEDAEAAAKAHASLLPGQALVSPQGQLWRWDGLIRNGRQDASERIRQRQRLEKLTAEAGQMEKLLAKASSDLEKAEAGLHTASSTAASSREGQRSAEEAARLAGRQADAARLAAEAGQTRQQDLEKARQLAEADLAELGGDTLSNEEEQRLQEEAETARQTAEAARSRLAAALQAQTRLVGEMDSAARRLKTIAEQRGDWQSRQASTSARLAEMAARQQQADAEQTRLASRPAEIEQEKQKLADLLDAASAERQKRSDALVLAETGLQEAETALRAAEAEQNAAREAEIRAEAHSERMTAERAQLVQRIAERLDSQPEQLEGLAELRENEQLEARDRLEERLERLLRERDQMGPVNLRAEIEMEELAGRISEMEAEKEDLHAAISKLRAAIQQLNREGRARLLESFKQVNSYFSELFSTLFGGGHAELQLTESEDPLEAGLEIMASPPGKRLQSLSLLSGGEQALTALAIIFAVFLTNPAPICVLDEVDAPLDDSNVARFCDLLRDIAGRTKTRFLIVTHHRMTMARMDRLFGVTMEQKGISRLVSVDLQTAENMRERAVV